MLRKNGRGGIRTAGLLLASALALAISVPAQAGGLIRDSEAEAMLRKYSNPIFQAAGLTPSAVDIYIVDDDRINAFVAGGQKMFIHTGLINEAESPNMIIGVIAHETGHIAGGHLSRGQEALAGARIPLIVSTILGIGAIAAGAGDAGMAILAGGTQVAQRSILQYSRVQEAAADQAAVTYLDRVGWSGRGLMETFETFRDQELLSDQQQDPYVRSHPVSSDRLASLEDRVTRSPFFNEPDPPGWDKELKMVQAKLHGFLARPDIVARLYPASDQSDPARYARAVAYHRTGQTDLGLSELAPLLEKEPSNPYFWELKGQILFESGRVRDALPPFEKAVDLAPDQPLIQVLLAQAMLATEDPALVQPARDILIGSIRADGENSMAFAQLAIAHARMGNEGLAQLATAERFYVAGDLAQAKEYARRAQTKLESGSPNWLRAEDIIQEGSDKR